LQQYPEKAKRDKLSGDMEEAEEQKEWMEDILDIYPANLEAGSRKKARRTESISIFCCRYD
jgi:hypothetical protein